MIFKEKISRQKIQKKADAMLMGEIIAKKALSEFSGEDIKNIRFKYNENGKPYLSGRNDIFFNISHSEDYIAVAISDEPVGIDIEKIKPVNLSVIKRVLNPEELKVIEKAEDDDSEFIKLWTKKEAVIKLYGKAMATADIKHCIKDESIETKRLENYWLSIAQKGK